MLKNGAMIRPEYELVATLFVSDKQPYLLHRRSKEYPLIFLYRIFLYFSFYASEDIEFDLSETKSGGKDCVNCIRRQPSAASCQLLHSMELSTSNVKSI